MNGRLHNVSRYQVVVILAVLVTSLPPSTGYIDCRISCRRCHENTEHPSVLEVYCAMCEECKQRRRERLKGRPTSARTTLIRMRDGVEEITKTPPLGPQAAAHPPEHLQQARQRQAVPSEYPAPSGHPGQPGQAPLPMFMQQQPHPQLLQQEPEPLKTFHEKPRPIQRGFGPEYERPMQKLSFPAGCPTPPPCPESEEETEVLVHLPTTCPTTTAPVTTHPTTPQCPPIRGCRKKKKPQYQGCWPCMPMCPCPPNYQSQLQLQTTPATTHLDYQYLYIGLPKNILRSS
ncbi:hypothetical protein HW555_008207 [Spodoptera exigua]|uniref:Uncharacterized protein n=1 Tax=Spodoptera exigua TaxID=7107 RepID=A0A835L4N2_SPOEX|nr:hypothetical protein HW555_008207 [Spodoptera exigua]